MDKILVTTNFEIIDNRNLLFVALEELQTKVNEIVDIINTLECNNFVMTPIQERE